MTTTHYPLAFSPDDLHQHRQQLCQWVKANGLNPHDIPDTHPLRVEEGQDGPAIRYQCFVRNEHGDKMRHPRSPDEVWTVEAITPCTIPPPRLGTPAPQSEQQAST